jgi:putative transposase
MRQAQPDRAGGRDRERFAVVLLPAEPEVEPGAAPEIGVPGAWVDCAVPRAWVLRYTCGGEWLPQAKVVRAALIRWAADRGLRSVRVAVLARLDEAEVWRLLRAWDMRRGGIGSVTTLAYPIALPGKARDGEGQAVDLTERLGWLFADLLPWANERLVALHREEVYEAAGDWPSPVWKHGDLGDPPGWAPSRVGRCVLETVGRIIRSQAERRRAFEALRAVWDEGVESELAAGRIYPVARRAAEACSGEAPTTGLLLSVAEQMAVEHRQRTGAHRIGWESFCGVPSPPPWPATYVKLQRPPVMNRPLLTYAADDGASDGQAVRYALVQDGLALVVRLLVPADPELRRWSWCEVRLEVPSRLRRELQRGGRLLAPDLRQSRSCKWVLDVKVQALPKGTRHGAPGRVLAFDWGLRKLVSAVVVEEGRQVSRPFFLRVGSVYVKLKELRAHASLLRKKADRLKNRRLFAGLSGSERENIEAEEKRTRGELETVWHRYAELQEELAHLASNFLLTLAEASGCGVITGEWLGSLRSSDKSRDLNWRINSQIRSAIVSKLRHKARRVGISVRTVWPRGTSHRCPRCGAAGQRIADRPPHAMHRHKPGRGYRPRSCSWFSCGRCGFNGDRDYVAALNIGVEWFAEERARRAAGRAKKVTGRRLSQAAAVHRQAVSYRGAAAARPFPSQNERIPFAGRRRGYLHGWRNRQVRVRPVPIYIRMVA